MTGLPLGKRDAQDRALELVSMGQSLSEAMEEVGRDASTWRTWRQRDPWFASRVRQIRAAQRPDQEVARPADPTAPEPPPTTEEQAPTMPVLPLGTCQRCGARNVPLIRSYSGQLRCLDRRACANR